MISGVGFAIARISGRAAIFFTAAAFSTPGPDRPMKMSAPSIASSSVRSEVSRAYFCFHGFMPSVRPV